MNDDELPNTPETPVPSNRSDAGSGVGAGPDAAVRSKANLRSPSLGSSNPAVQGEREQRRFLDAQRVITGNQLSRLSKLGGSCLDSPSAEENRPAPKERRMSEVAMEARTHKVEGERRFETEVDCKGDACLARPWDGK